MRQTTLLVIAGPHAAYLQPLTALPPSVRILISNQEEELIRFSPEADVILYVNTPHLLRALFPHARRVQWIHSLNTGVEPILSPEVVASQVIITNARGAYKNALAEFVIAGVLFFTKDISQLVRNQAQGIWQQFDAEEMFGKILGIVGYGETGRACAKVAHAHGMGILALRRRPELSQGDPLVKQIFAPDQLRQMLPLCDFVVLSAPGTPLTRHLIGEEEIRVMKRRAVLINVGRGSVVDEASLIEALRDRRIRGAALDVFETEPLPAGHPYYAMNNVLLSPHCTDHVPGWRERAMEGFLVNLSRFLLGEPMENIVDKVAGY